MNIILAQSIQLEDLKKGCRIITKEFQSNVIPHKGDLIYDSLWEDPYEYEVIEIIINYENDECSVTLAPRKLETNEMECLKEYVEMSKLHGWKCEFNN